MESGLFELLKRLSASGVNYVVCGGVACVLQGVERATYDLDISVSFDDVNLQKIIEVTKEFRLIPRIPEPVENLLDENSRKKWVEEKGALVYTFVSPNSALQLDIFLSYPKTFDELLMNSDKILIDNFKIEVSSLEDLLYVKRKINPLRDKDLQDIKELERIREKN